MSKKFDEWCQKTSQNQIYKQIFFIALQNSRPPLQHIFDNVRTASGNYQQGPLWNRSQNSCHTIFRGIHVHKTVRIPFMALLKRGNRKKSEGTRSGEYAVQQLPSSQPGIGAHGLQCARALSWSSVHFSATLAEPVQNGLVKCKLPEAANPLWMMNSVFTLDFCKRLLFGHRKLGKHSLVLIPGLIFRDGGF